jgi:hypothetical protein
MKFKPSLNGSGIYGKNIFGVLGFFEKPPIFFLLLLYNMTSIFELKTNVQELSSSNQGTSQNLYEQHAPTRDIVGANFPNGAIHIRHEVAGQKWWLPSRSYMRTRFRLKNVPTAPDTRTTLEVRDDVAPAMGTMGNLFQSMEYRVNGKTVSRISDFVPQVDALETRLAKSRSWLSGIGGSTNFWDESFNVRQAKVTQDGLVGKEIISPGQVVVPLSQQGADPANTYAFTAATNTVTIGTGNAAQLNLRLWYEVGDFFTFTGFVAPVVLDVGREGNRAVVTAIANDGLTMTITPGVFLEDHAASVANVAAKKIIETFDDNASSRVEYYESIWQPPLSLMKVNHALPSGRYELILNPQTVSTFKKAAVESLASNLTPGVDFDFEIVDMYWMVATVDGPRFDNGTFLLDLENTRCQVDDVSNTGGLQQKNWDVSPSTYALTLAFQQSDTTDTRYSASKFKMQDNEELKLTRMFVNYDGMNKPQPDADPEYKNPEAKDYTIQRYSESHVGSGAWFDTGGAEDIDQWHGRGAYYYFPWSRDGTSRSTRVRANFQFTNYALGAGVGRVLIFDHSRAVARIVVEDGRVTDVQVEDA